MQYEVINLYDHLLNKYSGGIKDTISSISMIQDSEEISLEVIEEFEVDGFRKQKITREKLDYICSDYDKQLFKLDNSIEKNAYIFLNELDDFSIAQTLDLFTDSFAAKVIRKDSFKDSIPASTTSTSKFIALSNYLSQCKKDTIQLTFTEIETILGFKLCSSAYQYSAYWYPSKTHTITKSWEEVGYKLDTVSIEKQYLILIKSI